MVFEVFLKYGLIKPRPPPTDPKFDHRVYVPLYIPSKMGKSILTSVVAKPFFCASMKIAVAPNGRHKNSSVGNKIEGDAVNS